MVKDGTEVQRLLTPVMEVRSKTESKEKDFSRGKKAEERHGDVTQDNPVLRHSPVDTFKARFKLLRRKKEAAPASIYVKSPKSR